jgi:hypothetical protein
MASDRPPFGSFLDLAIGKPAPNPENLETP